MILRQRANIETRSLTQYQVSPGCCLLFHHDGIFQVNKLKAFNEGERRDHFFLANVSGDSFGGCLTLKLLLRHILMYPMPC